MSYLQKQVVLKRHQLLGIAQRYAQNKATVKEQKALETFYNRMQLKHAQVPVDPELQTRSYNRISNSLNLPQSEDLSVKHWRSVVVAVCACLVLSLGLTFWWTIPSVMQTQRGEQVTLNLSDGSIITLSGNSKLEYPKHFLSNKREVTLTGEAFFKVARDTSKPFIIHSNNYKTQVLGTSFNINAKQENNLLVSVNTGKVKVQSEKDTLACVYLTKNEQALFSKHKLLSRSSDNSADYSAWTQRTILLKNTTMAELKSILEDWYNVEITITDPTLKKETLSGKFKNEPLETVLESIALIKHLNIENHDNKHISINRK